MPKDGAQRDKYRLLILQASEKVIELASTSVVRLISWTIYFFSKRKEYGFLK